MTDHHERPGAPDEGLAELNPSLSDTERRALRSLDSSPLPRDLETRVVKALRAEGLVHRGWPVWLPSAPALGAAAGLACTFALGVLVGLGIERPDGTGSPRAQATGTERGVVATEPRTPVIMTQFYQDGTDPFQHYSLAEEHPQDTAVLVKTWEY
jgi:hypothetical protein